MHCRKYKALNQFIKDKTMPDGHKNTCIECSRAYYKQYRKDHLEQERLRDRKRGVVDLRKRDQEK